MLGEYDRAIEQLDRATTLSLEHVGEHDTQTITAMGRLAMAYGDAGQLPKCMEVLERSVNLSVAALGPKHEITHTLSHSLT